MSKEEAPQDVIEAYRKSQARSQRTPWIFALAALLVIAGIAALIFWLTGSGESNFSVASLFVTKTPVPAATATPTPEPPTHPDQAFAFPYYACRTVDTTQD